jgi:hypothetical protein
MRLNTLILAALLAAIPFTSHAQWFEQSMRHNWLVEDLRKDMLHDLERRRLSEQSVAPAWPSADESAERMQRYRQAEQDLNSRLDQYRMDLFIRSLQGSRF